MWIRFILLKHHYVYLNINYYTNLINFLFNMKFKKKMEIKPYTPIKVFENEQKLDENNKFDVGISVFVFFLLGFVYFFLKYLVGFLLFLILNNKKIIFLLS